MKKTQTQCSNCMTTLTIDRFTVTVSDGKRSTPYFVEDYTFIQWQAPCCPDYWDSLESCPYWDSLES